MPYIRRLSTSLALIGVALIVLSLFEPYFNMGLSGAVEPGEYKGRLYLLTCDVHISVEVQGEGRLSLYLLNWEDSLLLLQFESLEGVEPVVQIANVSAFDGTITILVPGLYSLVVVSESGARVQYEGDMSRVLPQRTLLLAGSVLLVVGFAVIVGIQLTRKLARTAAISSTTDTGIEAQSTPSSSAIPQD